MHCSPVTSDALKYTGISCIILGSGTVYGSQHNTERTKTTMLGGGFSLIIIGVVLMVIDETVCNE